MARGGDYSWGRYYFKYFCQRVDLPQVDLMNFRVESLVKGGRSFEGGEAAIIWGNAVPIKLRTRSKLSISVQGNSDVIDFLRYGENHCQALSLIVYFGVANQSKSLKKFLEVCFIFSRSVFPDLRSFWQGRRIYFRLWSSLGSHLCLNRGSNFVILGCGKRYRGSVMNKFLKNN